MKKILLTLVLMVGVVLGLFAQKLTYQAVIRDNNQQLVVNTAVKATVTIDFAGDQADYTTTITDVSTNLHGLLSIEFGDGSLVGRDWTGATIAVKVVNAATSSIVYVNDEPRPVSAVPYALSVNGQYIQNYLTEHNYVDLTKLNDTLDAYSTTDVLNGLLQQLSNKLDVQIAKLDSIAHIVDSLAKLPHGGGEVADGQPCPNQETVTDVDGNEYNTVKIGNQCWMKENLRTFTNTASTGNIYTPSTGGYNVATFGRLYDWKAVMQGALSSTTAPSGVRGICPTGWHVPSDAEWDTLTNYVNSVADYRCEGNIAKALASTTGWSSNTSEGCNAGNTGDKANATGFSAVPAGYYHSSYTNFGYGANFWSATQFGNYDAYYRFLFYNTVYVGKDDNDKGDRLSVRCLKD